MLPLYSSDCKVEFPSYQDIQTSGPPPGILINLQRLNVPCNSGSFVRIDDSEKVICGKLEELNSNERTYHFDILKNSKIQFYKNPMFSLTYKLVNYCYNLTLTNETGEYLIAPGGKEALECYFHIHLPYGNKIDLQLVINNHSEVSRTSVNSVNTISLRNGNSYRDRGSNSFSYSNSVNKKPVQMSVNSNINSFFYYHSDNYFRDNSRTSSHNLEAVNCDDVFIQIYESVSVESMSKWTKCVNNDEASSTKQYNFVSESNRLIVYLFRRGQGSTAPGTTTTSNTKDFSIKDSLSTSSTTVYFNYVAKPIREIVSECAFGWVAMQQFCIKPFHILKSWMDSEAECIGHGGHMTSIRTESEQHSIDTILMNR